ncbi:class II glutamine amidotransferase, partial [Stieleria bergensis]|uniref:class II glutamine amidotransferase n=1 Tax=Stieleria bergensis TaxID=2528025 RepID=UPI003AF3C523
MSLSLFDQFILQTVFPVRFRYGFAPRWNTTCICSSIMCRLYGFRSNEPTKVECTLVHAQNALLIQSRSDEIGRAHSDGWGIGYYEDQNPHVERNASAAHHGLHFSNAAERVYSPTVISHVRLATVGIPTVENCHPFRFGNWV